MAMRDPTAASPPRAAPGPAAPASVPARSPRVSIGVPVFNGARYLDEALESIAAQTFRDWELIICDNASEDGTEAIGRRWEAADPRIRYLRNPTNIGSDRNFNRCAEVAMGDYFLTVAYDDKLHPDYLERTVAVLDRDPSVVFCHTRAYQIDENGIVIGPAESAGFSHSSEPHERFYNVLAVVPDIISAFGLHRLSVFRRTCMYITYPSSDAFLQAELALRGRLDEVPDFLFYRRLHAAAGHFVPLHDQFEESEPGQGIRIFFPEWRRFGEYIRAIFRVPMSAGERLRCLRVLPVYWRRRRLGYRFRKDVWKAARALLLRCAPRLGPRLIMARRRATAGKR